MRFVQQATERCLWQAYRLTGIDVLNRRKIGRRLGHQRKFASSRLDSQFLAAQRYR